MSCREIARFSEVYESLMNMEKPTDFQPGDFWQSKTMHGPENWNYQIKRLLREGKDWLFFTEDDHLYPPDALMRLLARELDVVSGLYLLRQLPFGPVLYDEPNAGNLRPHFLRDDETGMIEIDACGVGCLLVRRRVFEAMHEPWFVLTAPPARADKITGDVEFCRAVRKAGFKIWCDLDVLIDHVAVTPIRPVRRNGRWQTLVRCGKEHGVLVDAAKRMLGIADEDVRYAELSEEELQEVATGV